MSSASKSFGLRNSGGSRYVSGAIAVPAPDPRRWKALALVCVAFFMTILDVSIVNVALPSIGEALDFSRENLQWVISAYAITFGGFLLLAGRAADLLGRRRVFMVGVGVFTAASLVCGLANTEGVLIASRAVQGLGAAIVSPAALAIVTTCFREGPERNKALGIWGAVGGSGAAVGVLMGGILTKYLGWEWIFFVNVPVGIAVLSLTLSLVNESRIEVAKRRYDVAGALSVTSGLALLVYTISKAPDVGWGSARTIGLLILAAVLLIGFVIIEMRVEQPLMPLRIFNVRTVAGANIVGLILGAVVFANFFLLTLYVQQVLGYSALKAGLTFLTTAGTAVVSAGVAQALVTRVGVKPILAIGLALMTVGMLWYTQISVGGSYVSDLLVGYLAVGIGIAFSFVPVTIAALAGVAEHEAGLGSGLINTSQQIGGAIGVAIASTIATSHFTTLVKEGTSPPEALTSGFAWAFWFLVVLGAVSIVATFVFVHDREIATSAVTEPELYSSSG
ncbi:MAG TPA: MFS transporter [Gaiellaceae bacterium]|nr:MFS transporter [Gaiellaceae bacterium]